MLFQFVAKLLIPKPHDSVFMQMIFCKCQVLSSVVQNINAVLIYQGSNSVQRKYCPIARG